MPGAVLTHRLMPSCHPWPSGDTPSGSLSGTEVRSPDPHRDRSVFQEQVSSEYGGSSPRIWGPWRRSLSKQETAV